MQAIQAAKPVQNDIYHTIPVAPTEESHADKGIDHPLVTCDTCGTIWRAHGRSRCPMGSCEEGTLMILDGRQSSNLYVAERQLELIELSFTEPQLSFEIGKFRALLYEYAPWYDSTNRRMIQACYKNVCERAGTSKKAALAIALFKSDYQWASDDEKTFCRE